MNDKSGQVSLIVVLNSWRTLDIGEDDSDYEGLILFEWTNVDQRYEDQISIDQEKMEYSRRAWIEFENCEEMIPFCLDDIIGKKWIKKHLWILLSITRDCKRKYRIIIFNSKQMKSVCYSKKQKCITECMEKTNLKKYNNIYQSKYQIEQFAFQLK